MNMEKEEKGEGAESPGTVDRPLKDMASRDFCSASRRS